MMASNSKKFTGKHMAMVFIGGFGVVIAVNLVMASFAVSGFHGLVVDNSYVASQKFNGWMDEAEKSRALGWQVEARQIADGRIALTTADVPEGAAITAIARRPLGQHELANLTFASAGADAWTANEALAQGRWTLHLTVTAGGQTWTGESKLP
jgi:nitrogen fixation protein FixH